MDQRLVGQWPLPIGLTAALVFLLGVFAWWSYSWPLLGRLLSRRLAATRLGRLAPLADRPHGHSERFGLALAALRWISLLLVLGMLGHWQWQPQQLAPPRLVLLLDDSASMSGPSPAGEVASAAQAAPPQLLWGWPAARQWLLGDDARNLRDLSARYQLRIALVGDSLRWLDEPYPNHQPPPVDRWVSHLERVRPNRNASRLGEAVAAAAAQLQDHPPAAVLLLSDGIVTDGQPLEAAAESLARLSVPLWLLQTSDPDPALPVKVGPLLGPSHALLGDSVTLSASIRLPPNDGSWLDVRLVDQADGQPLASHRLALPTGGGERVCQWHFTPRQAGDLQIGVELVPGPNGSRMPAIDRRPGPQRVDAPVPDSEDRRRSQTQSVPAVEHRLRVRGEPLRVLLVQSEPSYEFRFLKSWLERDSGVPVGDTTGIHDDSRVAAGIEPVSWLARGAAGYARQDRTATDSLPSSREALRQFDVVVLGDVQPDALPHSFQPALHQFVQLDGGGLLVIAGPAAMPLKYADQPLAKLLPVGIEPAPTTTWPTPFGWQPTPLGLRLTPFQITLAPLAAQAQQPASEWAGLPPQRWHQRPLMPRPAAQVLARGFPDQASSGAGEGGKRSSGAQRLELPLVVSHYFGRGLVVYQATDETFQWTADDVSQRYYDQYWGGMLRWLSQPGRDPSQESPRWSIAPREPQPGELLTVTAWLPASSLERLEADPPRLELAAVSGADRVAMRSVDLLRSESDSARFDAQLPGLPSGEYQARWESPPLDRPPDPLRWVVQRRDLEGSLPPADRHELDRATQRSGGRWLRLTDADRVTDLLPAGTPQPVGLGPPQTLWNHPAVVGGLVLLLSLEWLGRRRAGLR
jgi:hypothetical protein